MPRCRLFCTTITPGRVTLSPEESGHAVASLRVQPDEEVILFDGAGKEAVGRVTSAERHLLQVEVTRVTLHPFELPRRITLAVAMPKTHRQGYLIEKCTELGVAAIWPILAARSVTRPSPAAVEKWSRRAIEAAKQSGRTWVPTIAAPQAFGQSLARIGDFDAAAYAHAGASATPITTFLADQPESSEVIVWIGPEGGWTDAERKQAVAAGAMQTRLAPTILRTETAAVAVCAAAALCDAASDHRQSAD